MSGIASVVASAAAEDEQWLHNQTRRGSVANTDDEAISSLTHDILELRETFSHREETVDADDIIARLAVAVRYKLTTTGLFLLDTWLVHDVLPAAASTTPAEAEATLTLVTDGIYEVSEDNVFVKAFLLDPEGYRVLMRVVSLVWKMARQNNIWNKCLLACAHMLHNDGAGQELASVLKTDDLLVIVSALKEVIETNDESPNATMVITAVDHVFCSRIAPTLLKQPGSEVLLLELIASLLITRSISIAAVLTKVLAAAASDGICREKMLDVRVPTQAHLATNTGVSPPGTVGTGPSVASLSAALHPDANSVAVRIVLRLLLDGGQDGPLLPLDPAVGQTREFVGGNVSFLSRGFDAKPELGGGDGSPESEGRHRVLENSAFWFQCMTLDDRFVAQCTFADASALAQICKGTNVPANWAPRTFRHAALALGRCASRMKSSGSAQQYSYIRLFVRSCFHTRTCHQVGNVPGVSRSPTCLCDDTPERVCWGLDCQCPHHNLSMAVGQLNIAGKKKPFVKVPDHHANAQLHGKAVLKLRTLARGGGEGSIELTRRADELQWHQRFLEKLHRNTVHATRVMLEEIWMIEVPEMLISVTGGAKDFDMPLRGGTEFMQGLMKTASTTNALILTGGTNTGVMQWVGTARGRFGSERTSVIGVATWGIVSGRESMGNGGNDAIRDSSRQRTSILYSHSDSQSLNEHHTHFVLVDDGREGQFGGEIQFRASLEASLCLAPAGRHVSRQLSIATHALLNDSSTIRGLVSGWDTIVPIVTIVLQGGIGTLETVRSAKVSGSAIVLVKNSGGAADVLAAADEHFRSSDPLGHLAFCLGGVSNEQTTQGEGSGRLGRFIRSRMRSISNATDTCRFVDHLLETGVLAMPSTFMPDAKRSIVESVAHHDGRILTCDLGHVAQPGSKDAASGVIVDLDTALLNAIMATVKNPAHKLAMAVKLNRADVGSAILTEHIQAARVVMANGRSALDEALLMAIELDRIEFVDLLIQYGASTEMFRLPKGKVDSNAPGVAVLGRLYDFSYRLERYLREGIHKAEMLVHQRYDKASVRFFGRGADLGQGKIIALPKPRQVLVRDLLLRHLMGHRFMGSAHGPDEWFNLFVWAVFSNRFQLARLFWKQGDFHVRTALVGAYLWRRLSSHFIRSVERQLDVTHHADVFEGYAKSVIGRIYIRSRVDALFTVQGTRWDVWDTRSVLDIAFLCKNETFVTHVTCDEALVRLFTSRPSSRRSALDARNLDFRGPLASNMVFMALWFFSAILLPYPFALLFNIEDGIATFKQRPTRGSNRAGGDMDSYTSKSSTGPHRHHSSLRERLALYHRDKDGNKIWRTRQIKDHIATFYLAVVTRFIMSTLSHMALVVLLVDVMLSEKGPVLWPPSGSAPGTWIPFKNVCLHLWIFCLLVEEGVQMTKRVWSETEDGVADAAQRGVWHRRLHSRGSDRLAFDWDYFLSTWNILDQIMLWGYVIGALLTSTDNHEIARWFNAIIVILFFVRIMNVLAIQKRIGPLLTTIHAMLADIAVWMFIFIIICISFSYAFQIAADNPQGLVHYAPIDDADEVTQGILTLTAPYWQLFGDAFLTEPFVNRGQGLSVMLLAAYLMLSNVLLVNLLIALMASTFERHSKRAMVDWMFERYTTLTEFRQKPPLPPPLVLIWRAGQLLMVIVSLVHRAIERKYEENAVSSATQLQPLPSGTSVSQSVSPSRIGSGSSDPSGVGGAADGAGGAGGGAGGVNLSPLRNRTPSVSAATSPNATVGPGLTRSPLVSASGSPNPTPHGLRRQMSLTHTNSNNGLRRSLFRREKSAGDGDTQEIRREIAEMLIYEVDRTNEQIVTASAWKKVVLEALFDKDEAERQFAKDVIAFLKTNSNGLPTHDLVHSLVDAHVESATPTVAQILRNTLDRVHRYNYETDRYLERRRHAAEEERAAVVELIAKEEWEERKKKMKDKLKKGKALSASTVGSKDKHAKAMADKYAGVRHEEEQEDDEREEAQHKAIEEVTRRQHALEDRITAMDRSLSMQLDTIMLSLRQQQEASATATAGRAPALTHPQVLSPSDSERQQSVANVVEQVMRRQQEEIAAQSAQHSPVASPAASPVAKSPVSSYCDEDEDEDEDAVVNVNLDDVQLEMAASARAGLSDKRTAKSLLPWKTSPVQQQDNTSEQRSMLRKTNAAPLPVPGKLPSVPLPPNRSTHSERERTIVEGSPAGTTIQIAAPPATASTSPSAAPHVAGLSPRAMPASALRFANVVELALERSRSPATQPRDYVSFDTVVPAPLTLPPSPPPRPNFNTFVRGPDDSEDTAVATAQSLVSRGPFPIPDLVTGYDSTAMALDGRDSGAGVIDIDGDMLPTTPRAGDVRDVIDRDGDVSPPHPRRGGSGGRVGSMFM